MSEKFKSEQVPPNLLLKFSWDIFIKHFPLILFICLLVYIPLFAIIYMEPARLFYLWLNIPLSSQEAAAYINMVVQVVLFGVFHPLIVGAVTAICRCEAEGKKVTLYSVLDASLLLWGKHVWTSLLYFVTVILGSMLIIPGIFASVAFYFFPQVTALSGISGLKALTVSFSVVNGQWFKTAIVLSFAGMASYAVGLLFVSMLPESQEISVIILILMDVIVNTINVIFSIFLSLWFLNNYMLKVPTEPKKD